MTIPFLDLRAAAGKTCNPPSLVLAEAQPV